MYSPITSSCNSVFWGSRKWIWLQGSIVGRKASFTTEQICLHEVKQLDLKVMAGCIECIWNHTCPMQLLFNRKQSWRYYRLLIYFKERHKMANCVASWLMYTNSNFIFLHVSEHNILFIYFSWKTERRVQGFRLNFTQLSHQIQWGCSCVPVVVFQINSWSSKGLFHYVTGGISDFWPRTSFATHNRRTKQSTAITFKDQGLFQNV